MLIISIILFALAALGTYTRITHAAWLVAHGIDLPLGLITAVTVLLYWFATAFLISSIIDMKNGKKNGRKNGRKKKKNPEEELPFMRSYRRSYVERPLDESIEQCLAAEQLYFAGKRGEAKRIWMRLRKAGCVEAEYAMGCYFFAQKKFSDALRSWQSAADRGHGYAAFNLAVIFEMLQRDLSFMYKYAPDMSVDELHALRKQIYPNRLITLVKYLRIAAIQDVPEAHFNLAYIYRYGTSLSYNDKMEKHRGLAIYWAYRGAMRQHAGCMKMLTELYEELLPLSDEYGKARLQREIALLRKWLEKNADKLAEGEGVTAPVTALFGPMHHEKHMKYNELDEYCAFIKRVVHTMPHRFVDKNLAEWHSDNYYVFDRYVFDPDYWDATDGDRIPNVYSKLMLRGEGAVEYGNALTLNAKDKKSGVFRLKMEGEEAFGETALSLLRKDPYCVLAMEKVARRFGDTTGINKWSAVHSAESLVTLSLDPRGVDVKKYVYVPPKPEPDNFPYERPVASSPSSSSGSPWWLDVMSDIVSPSSGYYSYDGSCQRELKQDVCNSNIYFDSAGNKFYSSDGTNFTKW